MILALAIVVILGNQNELFWSMVYLTFYVGINTQIHLHYTNHVKNYVIFAKVYIYTTYSISKKIT